MTSSIYIFRTLYSGCGDMSVSVWTSARAVKKLLKERLEKFADFKWDDEMEAEWRRVVKEPKWRWDFSEYSSTSVIKRQLNEED